MEESLKHSVKLKKEMENNVKHLGKDKGHICIKTDKNAM